MWCCYVSCWKLTSALSVLPTFLCLPEGTMPSLASCCHVLLKMPTFSVDPACPCPPKSEERETQCKLRLIGFRFPLEKEHLTLPELPACPGAALVWCSICLSLEKFESCRCIAWQKHFSHVSLLQPWVGVGRPGWPGAPFNTNTGALLCSHSLQKPYSFRVLSDGLLM